MLLAGAMVALGQGRLLESRVTWEHGMMLWATLLVAVDTRQPPIARLMIIHPLHHEQRQCTTHVNKDKLALWVRDAGRYASCRSATFALSQPLFQGLGQRQQAILLPRAQLPLQCACATVPAS
jgi:hypothetical protein